MRGHLGVGGELDSLVGSSGSYGDGIGDDERGDKFAPIADDHGIQNVGARLQSVFDGLRSDEFSRRRFDQVFLAVGDEEIVVFVEIADVAGGKPAVFGENFAGGFGILVIALHDAGAFHKNLSVLGGADLNVGNWFAGTADAIVWIIAGDYRRSFRQAVALINRNANGPEKLGERLGKRGAAGRNDAQAAAGALADFLVNEFIGEHPLCFQG